MRSEPDSVAHASALEREVVNYEEALEAARAILAARHSPMGERWRGRSIVVGVSLAALLPFSCGAYQELNAMEAYCDHRSPNWEHLFNAWAPRCAALSDADCAWECGIMGECTALDGECMAASDEDCRASETCASSGRCSAAFGECVIATAGDCRNAPLCARSGHCTVGLDEYGNIACVASSVADCERSVVCRDYGACHLHGDLCVTPDLACERAAECHLLGLCSWDGEACVADEDEHCRHSHGCFEYGRCVLRNGVCV